ncbi:hypothetical protein Tco_1047675, partial [Tanacetum coccineum]
MSDSRGSILGLTAARALVSIQEMADHSHKWHDEESYDIRNLKENVNEIHGRYESYNEIYYGDNFLSNEELKCIQASKSGEDELRITPCNNLLSDNRPNLEETFRGYLEESCKRQDIFDEWMKRFRENTNKNLRRHDSAIKGLEEKVVRLAQAVATYDKLNQAKALDRKNSMIINHLKKYLLRNPKLLLKKVKRRIIKDQENEERLLESLEKEPVNTPLIDIIRKTPDYTKCLQELVSKNTLIEKVSMVKLNTRCSNVLQNELPPKEKDPRSFVLPCTIGRPMLATAYVRIDVFSKKISLEVEKEKIVFNANEGVTPLSVSF